MKNYLHIFFIFSIGFLCNHSVDAQDSLLINPARITALEKQIQSTDDDKLKVQLLNEYARLCFYNLELIQGFDAAIEARELSKKIDFKVGEAMYNLTLAAFIVQRNLHQYYLQNARIISARYGQEEININLDIPQGYPPQLNKQIAEKLITAKAYFEEKGEKEIHAVILIPLTYYYYYVEKDFDELYKQNTIAKNIFLSLDQTFPAIMFSIDLIYGKNKEDAAKEESEIIDLISNITDKDKLGIIYYQLGIYHQYQSRQPFIAVDYYLQSLEYFKSTDNLYMLGNIYDRLDHLYSDYELKIKDAEVLPKLIEIRKKQGNPVALTKSYLRGVWAMAYVKNYKKAKEYLAVLEQDTSLMPRKTWLGHKNRVDGYILIDSGRYSEAIPFFKKSFDYYEAVNHLWATANAAIYLAICYYKVGDLNNALKYALLSEEWAFSYPDYASIRKLINLNLSKIYEALGNKELAFQHLKKHQEIVETVQINEKTNLIMQTEMRSILEKSSTEIKRLDEERNAQEQKNREQRFWIISIAGALISAIFILFVLYRNNKNKQKANALLKEQKEEIESTLEKLESTQSQLIQSEKMASLGELTAGIAHEIQNPLNFVNNFSEVSKELLVEMKEEIANKNFSDVGEISNDIESNLEKINHHGKRAEAIVKGMLQHSRTNSGKKELTDLNALADEYLRLSYHGLRAKDKSFNADFKTEFDGNLPKINVVPQDIGRVLLNLINNAFYAVDKRAKTPQPPKGGTKNEQNNYKPIVIVTTSHSLSFGEGRGEVKIVVTDNGPGIPPEIKDKIFQPFFTTKPTGSGTGLGLSLSYDIVKAHGGNISVESEENTGTEFKITIPFQS